MCNANGGLRWAVGMLLTCWVTAAVCGESQVLQNVLSRPGMTLNGKWHVIVDPYENGYYDYRRQPFDAVTPARGGYFLDHKPADRSELVEYDFDTSPTLNVPGDWNSQDDRLFYYEGTVWYRRKFDYTPAPGKRVFVHFGAANYQADVYLNGRKLGRHVGGFTPFEFEITGILKATDNSLVVKVDNTRHADAVPTVNTDWWNYGGLTREVSHRRDAGCIHPRLPGAARERIDAAHRRARAGRWREIAGQGHAVDTRGESDRERDERRCGGRDLRSGRAQAQVVGSRESEAVPGVDQRRAMIASTIASAFAASLSVAPTFF